MREIGYSREAMRTLQRMPANTSRLIRAKVEQYAAEPDSLANNVKALQGRPGHYRLRVGDWRVIFSETAEIIAIKRIAPRGSAYGE